MIGTVFIPANSSLLPMMLVSSLYLLCLIMLVVLRCLLNFPWRSINVQLLEVLRASLLATQSIRFYGTTSIVRESRFQLQSLHCSRVPANILLHITLLINGVDFIPTVVYFNSPILEYFANKSPLRKNGTPKR